MKNALLLFFLFSLLCCQSQQAPITKTFSNKDFKWTISVPGDYEEVDPAKWKEMQATGEDLMEEAIGEDVINQAKTVFVIKKGMFNYLEANYQPYDTLVDGNYLETNGEVSKLLYETFQMQMPGAQMDSVSSVEQISQLDFQKFHIMMDMPNGLNLHSIMYTRLFNKKEFSVNIIYGEEQEGMEMLEAWRKSTFE